MREVACRLGRAPSTISRGRTNASDRRNAATRGGELDYCATTAQWHAERAARRPKVAKLVSNAVLRTYVQDRLSGLIVTPGGAAVSGPSVSWNGRRHGRRQAGTRLHSPVNTTPISGSRVAPSKAEEGRQPGVFHRPVHCPVEPGSAPSWSLVPRIRLIPWSLGPHSNSLSLIPFE